MLTVAYLANQFPSPVEPYVGEEIEELRKRGVRVISGSVWKAGNERRAGARAGDPEMVLHRLPLLLVVQAAWLCLRRWRRILGLLARLLYRGSEGPVQRLKALLHTGMGACYAVLLKSRGVDHIHVHHGYFGSWIGMVAARLLNVGFSMTLHGSDLLLHGNYLDIKLESCTFCLTVSEYNRRFILKRHPQIDVRKVVVSRLGVDAGKIVATSNSQQRPALMLLAVGRLHAVKDHAFLVQACAELYQRGVEFECSIAGEGPERRHLESLISKYSLEDRVTLLGHVAREQMPSLYDRADIVILTSRSEGLPLVLMEAMVRSKIVLAPKITGIPELVIPRKTGFLYEAGSLDDFISQILLIRSQMYVQQPGRRAGRLLAEPLSSGILSATRPLDWIRHAARVQVRQNFDRKTNLESFGDLFLQRIAAQTGTLSNENSVLQQVQLSVQRNRSLSI